MSALSRCLALAALVCAHLAAAEPAAVVVATYNLQNYTTADRRLPDGFRPDYPKPEREKTAVRAVLRSLEADLLAFQEIGGPGHLAELRRDLAREGLHYPHGEALLGPDQNRGLALLSRLPLADVRLHQDLVARYRRDDTPEPVRRGLLEARVLAPGGEFTVFVVHLKSRLAVEREDPAAENQRVAEARAVRDRILERFPDPAAHRFILLGDCNDLPGSRTLQALEARGRLTIARWIDAADSRGHRWTHAYERPALYSRFDHVLVSPGMSAWVGRAWIEDGPAVAAASDHRPVALSLHLSAAAPAIVATP